MKIIVPLRPQSVAELTTLLSQITPQVDIVEIWLDGLVRELMQHPELVTTLQNLLAKHKAKCGLKYLAVCKTPAEQGTFAGTPTQRIQVLKKWLELGGDYIDVDITQNDLSLISQLPKEKLWLSFHDFNWAEIEIIQLRFEAMQTFEPAVYKFAVTPESEKDLNNFLQWCGNFKKTAIFTTMGAFGAQGREQLKKSTYGAFYALSPDHTTASGQPTLQDL